MYLLNHHSTLKECMSFMINNDPVLSEKLLQVYGYPKEIQAVNCMTEDEFTKIMSGQTDA